ncbi:MAG: DNA alkylation repair protein [Cytophagales bacterium]
MNVHHQEIFEIILANIGIATHHTFSDSYLGNNHVKYAIGAPVMRLIAKEWMREHQNMHASDFQKLITSLVKAKSSIEKMMAGMLLDVSRTQQRNFKPVIFDKWLNCVEGWAQVDTLCTGAYTVDEVPRQWTEWKKLLGKFSKSNNINKRRASLVFLCSPIRTHADKSMADVALANISQLKQEKEILITKAISWLLRSMVKHHKKLVTDYIVRNKSSLPAIAVRETLIKVKTGKKSGKL